MEVELRLAAKGRLVADGLSFLIVGTPRSGTTLVQRIVSEIPGVRVPPETHFFPLFGHQLLRGRRFPLEAHAIVAEIGRFLEMKTSRGLELDPHAVVDRLGGTCSRALDLFVAIVQELAGPATLYGEKTPNHLLWWRPLTRALPNLKVAVVIRDPRAVVNSYASAPFGMDSHVALAERWVCDQRLMRIARDELGANRFLELRYEDVVAEPASCRARLREFLGIKDGSAQQAVPVGDSGPARPLFMPWETWKSAALGPVVHGRVAAWRTELTQTQVHVISRICRTEMRAFGYEPETGRGAIHPADEWRRIRFRIHRARLMQEIEAIRL